MAARQAALARAAQETPHLGLEAEGVWEPGDVLAAGPPHVAGKVRVGQGGHA